MMIKNTTEIWYLFPVWHATRLDKFRFILLRSYPGFDYILRVARAIYSHIDDDIEITIYLQDKDIIEYATLHKSSNCKKTKTKWYCNSLPDSIPSGETVEERVVVFNVRLVEDKTVVSLIVEELSASVVSMNGVETVTVEDM